MNTDKFISAKPTIQFNGNIDLTAKVPHQWIENIYKMIDPIKNPSELECEYSAAASMLRVTGLEGGVPDGELVQDADFLKLVRTAAGVPQQAGRINLGTITSKDREKWPDHPLRRCPRCFHAQTAGRLRCVYEQTCAARWRFEGFPSAPASAAHMAAVSKKILGDRYKLGITAVRYGASAGNISDMATFWR